MVQESLFEILVMVGGKLNVMNVEVQVMMMMERLAIGVMDRVKLNVWIVISLVESVVEDVKVVGKWLSVKNMRSM